MSELRLHGATVGTVWDLLGHDENDLTFALGFGLSRSRALLRMFGELVAPGVEITEPVVIELQEHDAADGGFTDIELLTTDLHVIVEAKVGWAPPLPTQLRRYELRLERAGRPHRRLVVLTKQGAERIVRHQLGVWAPPPPARAAVVGWSDITRVARLASREGPLAERRLTSELAAYLRGSADMRNVESNSVYVVSVARTPMPGWPASITPVDIVMSFGRYFYPATGPWPRTPPNYVGFRFDGRLESIHHVDDYTVTEDMAPFFPGAPDTRSWGPHFLLTLGSPIKPPRLVRTGRGIPRSARRWIDIDLLLTSATISEAFLLTRKRREA